MYIKNIGELIKDQLPLKLKFFEGNTIYGKLISLEDGKGAIKLYDGTIIPAIFINENNLEQNKFTKFLIQGIDEDQILLQAVKLDGDISDEESIEWILKSLNIPSDKGKEIISSLLKFNLPASDENILAIYKNIKFLDNLKHMSESDILTFLQNNVDSKITAQSPEFESCKQIISLLKETNCDFLTFLIQNDIPINIENILKTKDFVDNKFLINSMINELKDFISKDIPHKDEIKNLSNSAINNLNEKDKIINHKLLDKNISINFNNLSMESIKNIINNIDSIKRLYNEFGINKLKDLSYQDIINTLSKNNNLRLTGDNIENLKSTLSNLNEDGLNFIDITLKSDRFITPNNIHINNLIDKIKSSNVNMQDITETINKMSNILKFNDDNELLSFIQNNIDKNIDIGTEKFNNIKNILNTLKDPEVINKVLSNNFQPNLNEKILVNDLKLDKGLFMDILNKIDKVFKVSQNNINILSLNDMIKTIQNNPESIKNVNPDIIKSFINNIDVLNHIDQNYNFYHFNLYNSQNLLKNTIIVKNKYKSSKYIDINDVKVYISVDTSRLGTVEGYLYKRYNDLFISLKSFEDNIKFIKDNVFLLKSALLSKGYNVIDISIEKIVSEPDIVNLSTFFNDGIFKELDVKV